MLVLRLLVQAGIPVLVTQRVVFVLQVHTARKTLFLVLLVSLESTYLTSVARSSVNAWIASVDTIVKRQVLVLQLLYVTLDIIAQLVQHPNVKTSAVKTTTVLQEPYLKSLANLMDLQQARVKTLVRLALMEVYAMALAHSSLALKVFIALAVFKFLVLLVLLIQLLHNQTILVVLLLETVMPLLFLALL